MTGCSVVTSGKENGEGFEGECHLTGLGIIFFS